MLDGIEERIIDKLETDCKNKIWNTLTAPPSRAWMVPEEWMRSKDYWEDLKQAAYLAHGNCRAALDFIGLVDIPPVKGPPFDAVQQRLAKLKSAHEQLADLFDEKLREYARGCVQVAEREIAYTSARNETDFDPSELVHAIMVAVHWDEMRSSLEVQDALKKALTGKREDGSWRPGRPFYMSGRALAVVPTTSEIVWPLATAVMEKPEINVADAAFEHYVEWLERTEVKMPRARSPFGDEGIIEVTGWASERTRGVRRIDLWATALAINTLLQIRDIFEERLWQHCKERYTVLPSEGLNKIEPVDLRLPHVHERLHQKLSQIFRDVQDDKKHKEAAYIFVLHGPPGSSKTSIAKAVAAEIWQPLGPEETYEAKFVRITPADFTRRGESRIDTEARSIFELFQGLRKVTVFFDEIDDLLHQRKPSEPKTFMRLIVPAMLNRLQDLRDACPRQEICVVFATNYIDQIESALLRRGRVDECIPLVYQDWESRRLTVWRNIHKYGISKNPKMLWILFGDGAFLDRMGEIIVKETNEQPWKVLDGLCKRIFSRWKDMLEEKKVIPTELEKSLKACITDYKFAFTEHEYNDDRNFGRREFQQEIFRYHLHSALNKQDYIVRLAKLDEKLNKKRDDQHTAKWNFKEKGENFWESMGFK